MTEETQVDVPQEGTNPFEETKGNETPSSSSDENNEADKTPSSGGEEENTQNENQKGKPLNEHPRWKEREDRWKDKFNDQEKRHQDDITSLREEFGTKKDVSNQPEIPSWFGGDQTQWDAYCADRDKNLQDVETRTFDKLNSQKTEESKAIEEATKYMKSEIESIESDNTLNPKGEKIDANKLLKIVMDNDLVDSKGKWNYKAGYRLMQSAVPKTQNRKAVAGATTSEAEPEEKSVNFKTSKDFQQNRPW